MKTDELISFLAAAEPAPDRHWQLKRFALALLAGGAAALLMVVVLFGVRADLVEVMGTWLFWAKVALPVGLLAAGVLLANRLGRPGVGAGLVGLMLLSVPLLGVWLGSALVLLDAPADLRLDMVLGKTWRSCPLNIALLSVPVFIAVVWALRDMAPTRLRLAGAAGGLLAGALATLAYTLHCPEMSVAFWGVWYVLGMLVPSALGAALGPALLKW
ncbi:DUF1109 domain-containing protein [Pseudomonas sp. CNPSo 3701]|uniref:DUF1109 domain-containing protein n=1 Tax=Pseudomonas sp. CNPSo 3701 TaxID=3027943 RepID=UPI00236356AE|nr:DUF1109 domain-containing protein [Pseudomonas sp. CNPSo 3701]MDD1508241.1 DUF1109 domain-containing protein [Pseudomonas sp. CNPSo 3701]